MPWERRQFKFTEFRDLVLTVFGEAAFLGQHNAFVSSLLKPTRTFAVAEQFDAYRKPVSPDVFGDQYADDVGPIENALGYFAIIGADPSRIRNQVSFSESAFQEIMASFGAALNEVDRVLEASRVERQQSQAAERERGDQVAHLTALLARLKATGLTMVLAEQNLRFVSEMGDRVYILENGMVKYQGAMAAFLSDEEVRRAYLAV